MKYCCKCGAQLDDNALFCISCGEPTTPNIKLNKDENAPLSNNPVIAKLKEIFSSKMMLVIAILVSVSVAFGIISSTSSLNFNTYSDDTYEESYEYYWGNDYSDLYDDYDDYYGQTLAAQEEATGVDFVAIMAVIAAWLLYAAAKDRSTDSMKTSGFTVVRVTNIITFVVTIIIDIMLFIIGIALTVLPVSSEITGYINEVLSYSGFNMDNMSQSMISTIMVVAGITLIVMAIGILVLSIFVYIKLQNTIKSLIKTAVEGEPARNVSPFIGVMCYIFGGIYGLDAMSTVTNPALALSYGALAAALIMTGIMLFKIKREMSCFVPVPVSEPVYQEQQEQVVQSEETHNEPVVETETEQPEETEQPQSSEEELKDNSEQ